MKKVISNNTSYIRGCASAWRQHRLDPNSKVGTSLWYPLHLVNTLVSKHLETNEDIDKWYKSLDRSMSRFWNAPSSLDVSIRRKVDNRLGTFYFGTRYETTKNYQYSEAVIDGAKLISQAMTLWLASKTYTKVNGMYYTDESIHYLENYRQDSLVSISYGHMVYRVPYYYTKIANLVSDHSLTFKTSREVFIECVEADFDNLTKEYFNGK